MHEGLRIYTKQEYRDKCDIFSNDDFFAEYKHDVEFLKEHEDIIEVLSKAKIIDYDRGIIETPYGTTHIEKLTTGTKAVLNILYLLKNGKGSIIWTYG